MSNSTNDQATKPTTCSRTLKRRVKSSIVRDVNGSNSTFKRFYQSGGRDYEQYRRWLQTLAKSDTSSSASATINLGKVKEEPVDMRTSAIRILPPMVPSTALFGHSQQSLSIPKISYPQRHLSVPITSPQPLLLHSSPSPLITTTTPTVSYDRSPVSLIPVTSFSSLPLINWSVIDVGRFIEKQFPEKNIARKFVQQKIDGRTLPLLTEDHLIRVFKMKLGPALNLLALISTIQQQNASNHPSIIKTY